MEDLKRRGLLKLAGVLSVAPLAAAGCVGANRAPLAEAQAVMTPRSFHSRRRFVTVPYGRIAYVEQGEGPVAVFLHGVPLNGFHWRHVMAAMGDMRRCIALDLMALGYTEIAPEQDVSFTAQAAMLAQFLDALGIDRIDLVGNDSGGAVAQIFAAHHPQRLRTLTLTNCDAQDNWPPKAVLPLIEAARAGKLVDGYQALLGNIEGARTRFSRTYADPSFLTDEIVRLYLEPFLATPARRESFHRYWLAFDPAQTLAIESRLRTLRVPTLIVWGLDDIFFDVRWGQWLRDAIPGAVDLVKVPKGKLFFPEDLSDALIQPLRAFLNSRA
jgi:pimeloyl-ACP methyl ester carboxylesterase